MRRWKKPLQQKEGNLVAKVLEKGLYLPLDQVLAQANLVDRPF